jgi:hypothetical protein
VYGYLQQLLADFRIACFVVKMLCAAIFAKFLSVIKQNKNFTGFDFFTRKSYGKTYNNVLPAQKFAVTLARLRNLDYRLGPCLIF